MTRTKLGLLGLCAMLFGLMAFSTAWAHAEKIEVEEGGKKVIKEAKWLILTSGGVLKTGAELHASVNLVKDTPTLVLHTEILKIKVLFLCTEVKAVEAKLLPEGTIGKELGVPSGSKILFSGCTTHLNGETVAGCLPTDPADGPGTVVTKPGHALIVLHELAGGVKDELTEIIPDTGLNTTFAVISLPAGCPIGTSVPVIGKFFLKDCEGKFLTHEIKHLVEEGPLSRLFTISDTAEHAATLLGSAWAFLTGEHEGLKWSGDPA